MSRGVRARMAKRDHRETNHDEGRERADIDEFGDLANGKEAGDERA